MNQTQLPLAQLKELEAAISLTRLSMEDALKVCDALANLAHDLFPEEGVITELMRRTDDEAANPLDAASFSAASVKATVQKLTDCARTIVVIGNETRAAFSRLMTEQLASGNHALMDEFQSFFKVLPDQPPDFMATMQQVISRSNSAIESVIRMSTQPPASHSSLSA